MLMNFRATGKAQTEERLNSLSALGSPVDCPALPALCGGRAPSTTAAVGRGGLGAVDARVADDEFFARDHAALLSADAVHSQGGEAVDRAEGSALKFFSPFVLH